MNALNKTKAIGMIVGSILLVTFSFAATGNTDEHMQLVIDKVRADKKLLVSENMRLSEDEADSFWPIYEKYQDEIILFRQRTAKLIEGYVNVCNTNVSDETAKKLLDEFISIEESKLAALKSYLPKFRRVLSDIKVARYF